MQEKPPCGRACERRKAGCQIDCPDMIKWKAKTAADKAAQLAYKKTQQALDGFQLDCYLRTTGRRRAQR